MIELSILDRIRIGLRFLTEGIYYFFNKERVNNVLLKNKDYIKRLKSIHINHKMAQYSIIKLTEDLSAFNNVCNVKDILLKELSFEVDNLKKLWKIKNKKGESLYE